MKIDFDLETDAQKSTVISTLEAIILAIVTEARASGLDIDPVIDSVRNSYVGTFKNELDLISVTGQEPPEFATLCLAVTHSIFNDIGNFARPEND